MSYSLCPSCGGDGTVAPDRGATGRPWCRPCLGTGLLLDSVANVGARARGLPTAPDPNGPCSCGLDATKVVYRHEVTCERYDAWPGTSEGLVEDGGEDG